MAIVTLKLDFKIHEGTLKIIDLGDGLAAGLAGFKDDNTENKILLAPYERSGAKALATVVGELPSIYTLAARTVFQKLSAYYLHIPVINDTIMTT